MKTSQGRILTVLLAALVLVGGANLAAYAANGAPLVLGHKNSAKKVTTLKNSKGTPLSLKSKAGTAPLQVSSPTTVTNLSADLLDGQDSADLKNKTYVYSLSTSSTSSDTVWALPGLPAGKYLATYSVAAAFSAAPSFFACYFIGTSGSISTISLVNGAETTSTQSYVSGAGYLDTTGGARSFGCEKSGGGTMTTPIPPFNLPSQVSLTRLDDVTTGASTGAPLVIGPRPGPGTLAP
jgi:hypothetical protein